VFGAAPSTPGKSFEEAFDFKEVFATWIAPCSLGARAAEDKLLAQRIIEESWPELVNFETPTLPARRCWLASSL
jgi:hypothetical protein